ncbi:unnamed protein product [[Candida] boidinii]|nr:unnamed protein product [[Candida] boidinii]
MIRTQIFLPQLTLDQDINLNISILVTFLKLSIKLNNNNNNNSEIHLPKVHVPAGAQNTLFNAGLSKTQIEALATLIAYHKSESKTGAGNGNGSQNQQAHQNGFNQQQQQQYQRQFGQQSPLLTQQQLLQSQQQFNQHFPQQQLSGNQAGIQHPRQQAPGVQPDVFSALQNLLLQSQQPQQRQPSQANLPLHQQNQTLQGPQQQQLANNFNVDDPLNSGNNFNPAVSPILQQLLLVGAQKLNQQGGSNGSVVDADNNKQIQAFTQVLQGPQQHLQSQQPVQPQQQQKQKQDSQTGTASRAKPKQVSQGRISKPQERSASKSSTASTISASTTVASTPATSSFSVTTFDKLPKSESSSINSTNGNISFSLNGNGNSNGSGNRSGGEFSDSNDKQNSDSGLPVEIDKRRRNTAASARFRIKKKLKEQEMEKNIKELTENSQKLELKIQQLEMENRLLRNLVVEKGAQRDSEELERLKKRAKISIEQEDTTNSTENSNSSSFARGTTNESVANGDGVSVKKEE